MTAATETKTLPDRLRAMLRLLEKFTLRPDDRAGGRSCRAGDGRVARDDPRRVLRRLPVQHATTVWRTRSAGSCRSDAYYAKAGKFLLKKGYQL